MQNDPYKITASSYDFLMEPFNNALRKLMIKMYPPREGMNVLEVGCGTGTNLKMYRKAGCKIYGTDLSPSMLSVARNKLGDQASLHLGDAAHMPYGDNFFDIVIAMLTLHEMPHYVRANVMSQMCRVLKDDGRLIVTDFHYGPVNFPMGWLNRALIFIFEFFAGISHFRNYKNFISNACLEPLIVKNNLCVESMKVVSGGNISLCLLKRG